MKGSHIFIVVGAIIISSNLAFDFIPQFSCFMYGMTSPNGVRAFGCYAPYLTDSLSLAFMLIGSFFIVMGLIIEVNKRTRRNDQSSMHRQNDQKRVKVGQEHANI